MKRVGKEDQRRWLDEIELYEDNWCVVEIRGSSVMEVMEQGDLPHMVEMILKRKKEKEYSIKNY